MYRLEYKEPYIVQTEMLKNRTHQSYRWKELAVSEDLEALKEYKRINKLDNCRIIDANLEVVG
jgi:hypothetical protein